MEEQITVAEALERTISLLNGIGITIEEMERIGKPIACAVANIRVCLNAMNQHGGEDNHDGEKADA